MRKYEKQNLKKQRKRKCITKFQKIGLMIALLAVVFMANPELQVFAANPTPTPIPATPDLSNFQPLEILRIVYVLFMSVVAIMGGIQIVKSVQDWSNAMQQQDSTGSSTAIRGIVGGAIQAFVSVLMGIFGIVI